MTSNVQQLRDFLIAHPVGTKLAIATSQYATNTTAPGFRFDFTSTAPAVRSLIASGIIEGDCGWRYYDVTVVKNESPDFLLDTCNFDEDQNWYSNGVRIAWFDRSLKLWTSYLIDDKGNQRSETTYVNNRQDWADMQKRGWFDIEKDRAELAKNIDDDFWG